MASIPTEVKKNFFFTSCGSLISFTRANAQWVFHGFHIALKFTLQSQFSVSPFVVLIVLLFLLHFILAFIQSSRGNSKSDGSLKRLRIALKSKMTIEKTTRN